MYEGLSFQARQELGDAAVAADRSSTQASASGRLSQAPVGPRSFLPAVEQRLTTHAALLVAMLTRVTRHLGRGLGQR